MNITLSVPTPLDQLHREFLAMLPQIVAVARFGFRDVACPEKKADAIAEVVGLSWKWYCRLDHLGQKDRAFPTALAGYGVKQVKSGRGVAGQCRTSDAMNAHAQLRFGFHVEPIVDGRRLFVEACGKPSGQRHLDAWEEMLKDNSQTPVPDQVQFRLDWADWLGTRSSRDRRLIGDMSQGERTNELADKFRMSPARISQKRREFREDWGRFTAGEDQFLNLEC
jgi:hypothetical protein